MDFKIVSDYKPAGSQPEAIKRLLDGFGRGYRDQTLMGVTGSGKTFTMANIVEALNIPTLVMAPNKTLAAQLYSEFLELFPDNAVEYFVSYYDYYQPEAYLPSSDTYISKDADINSEIEKLKHRTTSSLLDRKDVLVVATVSAIYGLGSPKQYRESTLCLEKGQNIARDEIITHLVGMHYERRPKSVEEGQFRVRGMNLDILPPYSNHIIRIKCDKKVESIQVLDAVSLTKFAEKEYVRIYPAVHYILEEEKKQNAINEIRDELRKRIKHFERADKLVEANRIRQKTEYDLELISELGYCKGIENYSLHLEGRKKGEPPNTLLDFFEGEWLCFMDESHIGVPQVRGMHAGDESRKNTLVDYGFRLPSALDNRPLRFDEFDSKLHKVVYVSATPGAHELKLSKQIVEQLIRPTGLVDPQVEVRPAKDQVEDFVKTLREVVDAGKRALATTLTKRMSEDLADYVADRGFKVKYLHSEIGTLERVDILNELRSGTLDAVIGVNLLREGLDLPEVSLVALFDADQEGFLRSSTSLIQTIGRCSRNIDGKVILYADKVTNSMEKALEETKRRRDIQLRYNIDHGITPISISKGIRKRIIGKKEEVEKIQDEVYIDMPQDEIERLMKDAAERMDFEQAIKLRDILKEKERE